MIDYSGFYLVISITLILILLFKDTSGSFYHRKNNEQLNRLNNMIEKDIYYKQKISESLNKLIIVLEDKNNEK